jgi:hypothetical protein
MDTLANSAILLLSSDYKDLKYCIFEKLQKISLFLYKSSHQIFKGHHESDRTNLLHQPGLCQHP